MNPEKSQILPQIVIPAEAGIQDSKNWFPTFVGVRGVPYSYEFTNMPICIKSSK